MEIKILVGTETGNAAEASKGVVKCLGEYELNATVSDMQNVSIEDLKKFENVLIVTSTWGDGDAPNNAFDLLESLKSETDHDALSNLKYAVFALGESMYPNFCQAGIDFDENMNKLGAKRLLEIKKNEEDFYENISSWVDSLSDKLK